MFCHKHILPCTFVLMVLCIYECNLFPMHSYYCGRNLDFYMIVVNRSLNLSWMISQWFCWSWDMHRLVLIYLPTLLFYCFYLKSSINVNLQMKRDIELQKPVAYTNIWLGKRESDVKWNVWCPKSQRLTHQIENSKISGIYFTMKCFDSKRSNDMIYMEPNKKLQSCVIEFCGRSYMHISIIKMDHFI